MRHSPNRMVGLVLGALFLVLGGVGFVVTSQLDFFDPAGTQLLWVLQVNSFQNCVHILVGAAILMTALSNEKVAATANAWTGAFLLVLGLTGLFLVGEPFNILGLNSAANVLHFATSAVLLAAGLGADSYRQAQGKPDPLSAP